LLNSRRVDNGKPALGFLNPFIYQNPQGFQDVTQGKNTGGMQEYGFSAVKGWDAATGFGTPDSGAARISFFRTADVRPLSLPRHARL